MANFIDQSSPVYIKGAWNVICDRCGYQRKNFECSWDTYPNQNLFVCTATCKDTYQPGDRVRVPIGPQAVPIARPDVSIPKGPQLTTDIDS